MEQKKEYETEENYKNALEKVSSGLDAAERQKLVDLSKKLACLQEAVLKAGIEAGYCIEGVSEAFIAAIPGELVSELKLRRKEKNKKIEDILTDIRMHMNSYSEDGIFKGLEVAYKIVQKNQ